MIKQLIFFASLLLLGSLVQCQSTAIAVDIKDIQLLNGDVLGITVGLNLPVTNGLSLDLRVRLANSVDGSVLLRVDVPVTFTGLANELRTVFVQLDSDDLVDVTLNAQVSLRDLEIFGDVEVNVDISATQTFRLVDGLIKKNIVGLIAGIVHVVDASVISDNLMEVVFSLTNAVGSAVRATVDINVDVGSTEVATFTKQVNFTGTVAGQNVSVLVDISSLDLSATLGASFNIELIRLSGNGAVNVSLVADVEISLIDGVLVALDNVLNPIEQIVFAVPGAVDSVLVAVNDLLLAGSKSGSGQTFLRVFLNVTDTLQVGARVEVDLNLSILGILDITLTKVVRLDLEDGEEVVAKFNISSVVSTLLGLLSSVANITVSLGDVQLDVPLNDLSVDLGANVLAQLSFNDSGILTLNLL